MKWKVTIFESDGTLFASRWFRTMNEADAYAIGFQIASDMGQLKMEAKVTEEKETK